MGGTTGILGLCRYTRRRGTLRPNRDGEEAYEHLGWPVKEETSELASPKHGQPCSGGRESKFLPHGKRLGKSSRVEICTIKVRSREMEGGGLGGRVNII